MKETYFEITREKGEINFGVYSNIINLSQHDYDELRQLIIVAIGVMEEMRKKHFKINK